MPLVLSMKSGEEVKIGSEVFEVSSLQLDRFVLTHDAEAWVITEDRAMEVRPEVMVSMGSGDGRPHAKVVINAPREIEIERLGR